MRPQTKQNGFILILTLIFLVVLTVMALTLVSLNISQTRVAANATNSEMNFDTAEGAISEATNHILNGSYSPANFIANNNGLYVFNPTIAPLWTTINWSSSNSIISGFQGSSGGTTSYIIEQLPSVIMPGQNMKKPTNVYRITANSLSAGGNTATIVQSTVQLTQ